MNSAIMITFALTTISCFANGDIANCHSQDPRKIKVSELKNLVDRVKAVQDNLNTTVNDESIKRQPTVNLWISLATSNISAYATAAGKNGTKAYETCQSDFVDYMADYNEPAINFHHCTYSESHEIAYVLDRGLDLINKLEDRPNRIDGASDVPDDPVCIYDFLKMEIDENILVTDASKATPIQKAIQCLNDAQRYIEKHIKDGVRKTKNCIDSDGTER